MVVVRMTEMYDMCTTKNKIGLIGIHTPSATGMAKRWKGLFDNHRFYKILGCDVKIACASVLPADPLQVGIENGTNIAPQDMMNPLLYTTMTNEGWNSLVNRLYAVINGTSIPGIDTSSVKGITDAFSTLTDSEQEALYYQMLSSDKFRKAMPQNGLNMTNVKPFVHEVVATFGQTGRNDYEHQDGANPGVTSVGNNNIPWPNSGSSTSIETNRTIRGRAVPYPRLPCSNPGSTNANSDGPIMGLPNGMPLLTVNEPFKTYCCCIVLPPAKLHEFYFRMLVSWRIAFLQPCSMLEKIQSTQFGDTTDIYYRSYSFSEAKELDKDLIGDDDRADSVSSVDALNMSPELVMEK